MIQLLAVREQHPEIELAILFEKDNKISKNSKAKYSDWAQRHGIKHAFMKVPEEWFQ